VANLSPAEVARYALEAGFRGQNAATAVAVSQAENRSGSTTAVNHNSNGTVDVGLWQINSSNASPDAMTDPAANAAEAFRLASSGRGWGNWTTYRNKSYLLFLPIAEAAVLAAQAAHPGLGLKVGATTPLDQSTLVPGATPDPQQPSIIGELKAVVEMFNRVGAWISNADNWSRILYVGVGGALVIVAISAISKPVTEPIIKTAGAIK
jgi:hypothetical protein